MTQQSLLVEAFIACDSKAKISYIITTYDTLTPLSSKGRPRQHEPSAAQFRSALQVSSPILAPMRLSHGSPSEIPCQRFRVFIGACLANHRPPFMFHLRLACIVGGLFQQNLNLHPRFHYLGGLGLFRTTARDIAPPALGFVTRVVASLNRPCPSTHRMPRAHSLPLPCDLADQGGLADATSPVFLAPLHFFACR